MQSFEMERHVSREIRELFVGINVTQIMMILSTMYYMNILTQELPNSRTHVF